MLGIPGPARKPWKSMYFEASAIHDQEPLRFAYEMEWNFEKSRKVAQTLEIHSVFAPEFYVAFCF